MARPLLAAALVSLLALASACGAERAADEETNESEAAAVAPPIFLYYGAYHDWQIDPKTGAEVDRGIAESITTKLIVPGAESVLVTTADVPAWRAAGGRTAFRLPRSQPTGDDLETTLAEGADDDAAVAKTAEVVRAILARGFDYVAIDELNDIARPHTSDAAPNLAWRNGGRLAARWAKLVATPDLERRLVLFVSTYDLRGKLDLYGEALAAAAKHTRVVASEIYVSTGCASRDAPLAIAKGRKACDVNRSSFEALAAEMEAAAPGIARRSITVLGLSDAYTEKRSDAFCEPGGALREQLAALHAGKLTRKQRGLGGFSPTHATWGQVAQAECLQRLTPGFVTHER